MDIENIFICPIPLEAKHYLYSYNDINSDRRHLSGDYASSNLENTFTLMFNSHTTVDTMIDFVIP